MSETLLPSVTITRSTTVQIIEACYSYELHFFCFLFWRENISSNNKGEVMGSLTKFLQIDL